MPEPITTTTTAVVGAASKSALLQLIVHLLTPVLSAMLVMLMIPPRSAREFAAMLISTLSCSIALGSYLIARHIGIDQLHNIYDLAQAGGLFFAAGLPGWVLVRALFIFFEENKQRSLIELIHQLREAIYGRPKK